MTDALLDRKRKGLQDFKSLLFFAIAFLFLVFLLYIFEPFSDFWNDLLANLSTIFSSGMSAFLAGLVLFRYAPTDQPRRAWMPLTIGLWLWMIAEVIWTYYNMTLVEVGISIVDLFWVVAYGFFGFAAYIQYQIVFRPNERARVYFTGTWLGSVVLLTALISWILIRFTDETFGLSLLIAAFYPAADIVVGLSAVIIILRFRGSALAYPWIGLFSFSIADLLYAFLEFSGIYAWSLSQNNIWSITADVSYIAAYLFVALGCYAQLLLLQYGPIFIKLQKDSRKT